MMRYVLILVLLIASLWAVPQVVVLDDALSVHDDFEMMYYKDATNALGIEEIASSSEFQRHSSRFSFGYIPETLWLRIDFKNRSKREDFILSLNEHFYEKANMYYHHDDSWKKIQSGVFTPIKERDVQTPKFAYNLKIPHERTSTIYIELKGKYSYFGDIEICTKDYFFTHQLLGIDSFFIFQFGILIIIILFNLFLWFNLREKVFIYYVGYTFFALIYLINISGLLAYFDLQHYMYKLHFSVALSIIFLSLFSIEYFEAKKHFKFSVYILNVLALILFLCASLMLIYYSPWNSFINHIITLMIITLIITSIALYLKGERFLKYYIFAILIYFISVIVFIFFISGVIEYNYFTRYAYLYSLSLEIIIFSLMLANRYNVIKNKQIQTQDQLIDLQNNQNKILEQEVKKQTKKLQTLNTKLSNVAKERELLVKEVFHRVKNNFHMISAFLWFESEKEKDKNRFSELINRIKSMSLIHEYVCNSKDLVSINAHEYLEELIRTVLQSYVIKNIRVEIAIEKIYIDFEHSLTLGVIVNEVLSNSIKHHPKQDAIVLEVLCTKKEDEIVLRIKDNGLGFDATAVAASFGREIIEDFSKKLPESEYFFRQENGSVFELKFKDIKHHDD